MKRLLVLLLLTLSIFADGQGLSENGKYFYHRESTSGNFFDKQEHQIDSVIFFCERKGDTLIYWTIGSSTPYDKKKFNQLEKNKDFGKFLQRGLTLNDGRVTVHKMSSTKFLVRNDSLFQWSEIYLIDEDSIASIKARYEGAETERERERFSDIMDKSTKEGFVFIFSARLFADGHRSKKVEDRRTKCWNNINLRNYWVVNKTGYYDFVISNDCGLWGSQWGFTISERLEFIRFGGYSSKEMRMLTKETNRTTELIKY